MKENNDWITQGIKLSCKHKRSVFTSTKNSNDPKVKAHYIKYCNIPEECRSHQHRGRSLKSNPKQSYKRS
jgi:ribosomal protein L33